MKMILPLAAVSVLVGVAVASYPARSLALPDCEAIYEQCLANGVNPATCESEFMECESIGHGHASHDHHLGALMKRRENH